MGEGAWALSLVHRHLCGRFGGYARTMQPSSESRCLYCLSSEGSFTAREHPIAESIGNHSVVLPVGVVCDRCNNGVLAVLDRILAEFFPVKLRRTRLGVPNKEGKVPDTAFQDGRLCHNGQFAALVGNLNPSSWEEEYRSARDPRYSVGIATLTGGRPVRGRHAEEISRALLKVGFGCAWIEQGELLRDEEFNEVRAMILGERRPAGYLFIGNEVDERNTTLNVSYKAARDGEGNVYFRVHANFYGVSMVTDSRALPRPALAELGTTISFGDAVAG
jgi:hypothetical protein